MSENAPLQQPPRKAEVLAKMSTEGIGLFQRAEERLSQLGAGQSAEETPFERKVSSILDGTHPRAASYWKAARRIGRKEITKEFLTAAHDGFITTLNQLFAPVSRPVEATISKAVAKIIAYTKG